MPYQPIRQFPTQEAALRQALERMDDSVARTFQEERILGIRRMPHRLVSRDTSAAFDEVIEVNTADGDVVVRLPPITPPDIDRVVEIVGVGGGNDIIVRAVQTISSGGGGTTEETWLAGFFGIIRYKACLTGWQVYNA
jgi:hypothetical protein